MGLNLRNCDAVRPWPGRGAGANPSPDPSPDPSHSPDPSPNPNPSPDQVTTLGCYGDPPCGLQILGTERHESRRIDRQLRGRAGRQGDPGSSSFFLSLEDDLMRLFGTDRVARVMTPHICAPS